MLSAVDPGYGLAEKVEITFPGIVGSLIIWYFFIGEIICYPQLLLSFTTLRLEILDYSKRLTKSSYFISSTISIP